jgi:phage terminase Nu1 subunit (DNA packaging protein)
MLTNVCNWALAAGPRPRSDEPVRRAPLGPPSGGSRMRGAKAHRARDYRVRKHPSDSDRPKPADFREKRVTKTGKRVPVKNRKPEVITLNLEAFADLCGVTPRTMQQHLKQAPVNAPWLLDRGGPGRSYRIEPHEGAAWFRARRTPTATRLTEEQQQRLAGVRANMLGEGVAHEDLILSGKRRYEEYKAAEAELAYRKALGELCPVAEMHDALTDLVIRYRSALAHIPAAMRRRFNLEREAEDWLYQTIADGLKEMVRGLDAAFHADHQLSPLLPDDVRPAPLRNYHD